MLLTGLDGITHDLPLKAKPALQQRETTLEATAQTGRPKGTRVFLSALSQQRNQSTSLANEASATCAECQLLSWGHQEAQWAQSSAPQGAPLPAVTPSISLLTSMDGDRVHRSNFSKGISYHHTKRSEMPPSHGHLGDWKPNFPLALQNQPCSHTAERLFGTYAPPALLITCPSHN